jgi:hypothetical protein
MQAQEIAEYRRRWQAVNEVEEMERRASTMEERWRQINAMIGMARALGLDLTQLDEDDLIVYERWAQIKSKIP